MWDISDDISESDPNEPAENSCAIPDAEALRETDKALLVKVAGTRQERWVPKSQIHDDSEVYAKGHKGKLVITPWLAKRWDAESQGPLRDEVNAAVREEADKHVVQDVVCLRESAAALLIRVGVDGDEMWMPKTQLVDSSEVKNDGDLGELHMTRWIAQQKGFLPKD